VLAPAPSTALPTPKPVLAPASINLERFFDAVDVAPGGRSGAAKAGAAPGARVVAFGH